MDYEFFDKLSIDDANLFLHNFLKEASNGFLSIIPEMNRDGVNTEYNLDNAIYVLQWVFNKLKTLPTKPDESLPKWIRDSSTYTQGLFDFDSPSGILLLRAAYFLGECFVRSSDKLTWATGDINSADKNMPVVTGFIKDMEMPPYLIIDNTFRRMIEDTSLVNNISEMIDIWKSFIPR